MRLDSNRVNRQNNHPLRELRAGSWFFPGRSRSQHRIDQTGVGEAREGNGAYSSVWLERSSDKAEVRGSSPRTPT